MGLLSTQVTILVNAAWGLWMATALALAIAPRWVMRRFEWHPKENPHLSAAIRVFAGAMLAAGLVWIILGVLGG